MSSNRLRRFLNLERPRPSRPDEKDPAVATAERFEGVERPGAIPEQPRTSGARLDRFGPEPDPPMELLDTTAADRPFTRCMRCGTDHAVFAAECVSCGASLDTEPQRELDDRPWAERRQKA